MKKGIRILLACILTVFIPSIPVCAAEKGEQETDALYLSRSVANVKSFPFSRPRFSL